MIAKPEQSECSLEAVASRVAGRCLAVADRGTDKATTGRGGLGTNIVAPDAREELRDLC